MDETSQVRKRPTEVLLALSFTVAMIALGYVAVGALVAVTFSVGFVTGFVLWFIRPLAPSFRPVKWPYILSLGAYAIHRTEEEIAGFVAAIEELSGDTAVEVTHPSSIALVVLSLAWLLSPVLIRRGNAFGSYGAWTLFTGFGVLELAHFVFPLLTPEPYGYFPGMATVPLLAAVAWWGLWRMWRTPGTTAHDEPNPSEVRPRGIDG